MTDETLKENLDIFNKRFENETAKVKNQSNFKSVNNIVSQFLKMTTREDNESYKDLMIEYFEEIKKENFPTGVIFRDKLYNKYVLKAGSYLMKRKDFKTSSNLVVNIVLGIVIDIVIYYLTEDLLPFYIPVSTILLILFALKSRITAKKENRYFKKGY